MKLREAKRIVMLGINGSGMRGLAILLADRGTVITGVDRSNTVTGVLREDDAAPAIASADMVIHTDAIGADHPLLAAAQAAGIPTRIYHEALGELSRERRTLAVTGTHGKSSTTSMLAHIFVAAGRNPSALVGAPNSAWNNQNARVGASDLFIVEADEYRDHFLALRVESAIITSIDWDHPDWFTSLADVAQSFAAFVEKISTTGALIIPAVLAESWPVIRWPANTKVIQPPAELIDLVLPGKHMQYNAWLAIQMAAHYGIDETSARVALKKYPGLGRRFELLGRVGDMDIVSDYGHHPAEIAATLTAARERYGNDSICAIFEAHTRERLVHFGEAFFEALALADSVILAPPFIPAGRGQIQGEVADALRDLKGRLRQAGREVHSLDSVSQLSHLLTFLKRRHAVAIAFSAGSLDGTLRATVNKS
jgi:UDP-N-acetylmuramate--alanine ligase